MTFKLHKDFIMAVSKFWEKILISDVFASVLLLFIITYVIELFNEIHPLLKTDYIQGACGSIVFMPTDNTDELKGKFDVTYY